MHEKVSLKKLSFFPYLSVRRKKPPKLHIREPCQSMQRVVLKIDEGDVIIMWLVAKWLWLARILSAAHNRVSSDTFTGRHAA